MGARAPLMIRSGASAPWGLDGGRGAVPRKVFEKDNGVKIPLPVRPCGDGTASQPRAERRRVVATRLSHHATAVVPPQLLLNREELLHLRVVSGQGSGLRPQIGSIPRRGTRSRGSLPRPHPVGTGLRRKRIRYVTATPSQLERARRGSNVVFTTWGPDAGRMNQSWPSRCEAAAGRLRVLRGGGGGRVGLMGTGCQQAV